jgi:hypothetical protein
MGTPERIYPACPRHPFGDSAVSRTNKRPLHEAVAKAAEAALADDAYVSAVCALATRVQH